MAVQLFSVGRGTADESVRYVSATVRPLAAYFVMNSVIYPAADTYTLLSSRLVSSFDRSLPSTHNTAADDSLNLTPLSERSTRIPEQFPPRPPRETSRVPSAQRILLEHRLIHQEHPQEHLRSRSYRSHSNRLKLHHHQTTTTTDDARKALGSEPIEPRPAQNAIQRPTARPPDGRQLWEGRRRGCDDTHPAARLRRTARHRHDGRRR